ncbi:MAG: hypothetical protein R3C68_03155 [Myxococcota bacterium]
MPWVGAQKTIEVYRLAEAGASFLFRAPTPGRGAAAFAINSNQVAYWGHEQPDDTLRRPLLLTLEGVTRLGPDTAENPGRIQITDHHAAYSFYSSPLSFVEATVIELNDGVLGTRQRVATGPSEVLDLNDERILIGRPRGQENEPSGDIWVQFLRNDRETP